MSQNDHDTQGELLDAEPQNAGELMRQTAPQPPKPAPEATSILAVIQRAATDPSVDIEKMERLLQMHERIVARDAEAAYNRAMSLMQSELPSITQKAEIKHGDRVISRYARFEDINDAVKPIMERHGFAMSFRMDREQAGVIVTGVLTHRDGHRESTSLALPLDTSGAKNAVQSIGSTVSYGKRYVMCALLNITTRGEDDDGQAAGAMVHITDHQAAELEALISEVGADRDRFLEYFGAASVESIRAKDYARAVKALEAKRHAAG